MALINYPVILVADEPTGNLDSINSRQVLKILRKLNTKHGTTMIMVSHDPFRCHCDSYGWNSDSAGLCPGNYDCLVSSLRYQNSQ